MEAKTIFLQKADSPTNDFKAEDLENTNQIGGERLGGPGQGRFRAELWACRVGRGMNNYWNETGRHQDKAKRKLCPRCVFLAQGTPCLVRISPCLTDILSWAAVGRTCNPSP